jgi:hypothetical protein
MLKRSIFNFPDYSLIKTLRIIISFLEFYLLLV